MHLKACGSFGGKCEEGESFEGCLQRESQEELGADARVTTEIFQVSHAYADRTVELHFFRCELLAEPQPLLGQEMRWVARDALADLRFPPADAELIEMLRESGGG